MDRQQVALLAVMTGAFFLMVLLAVVVGDMQSSKDGAVATSPIPVDKPLKKLRAKAGTQRENARALTSSREEAPSGAQYASTQQGPVETWGSLESSTAEQKEQPRDIVLERATPEEALEIVHAAIADSGDDALSPAEQYAGLGYVLTRQVTVDAQAIEEAFQKAKRLIAGDEDLHTYLYYRCKAWLAVRNYQAIHDELAKHSPEWLRPGTRSLEIGIMRAFAEEELEQESDAEVAYRWVMEASYSWQCLDDSRCQGVYRQAARRLARLYRKQGLDEEAVATTERMHVALDSIPGAA